VLKHEAVTPDVLNNILHIIHDGAKREASMASAECKFCFFEIPATLCVSSTLGILSLLATAFAFSRLPQFGRHGAAKNECRELMLGDVHAELVGLLESEPSTDGDVSHAEESFTRRSGRCYIPNTMFKNPVGDFVLVQNLEVGSQVLLSNSEVASVVGLHLYPRDAKNPCRLVELITAQTRIKISESHRIVVGSSGRTTSAKFIREGDLVCVGTRLQAVKKVIYTSERSELFRVTFFPDEAVSTYMAPQWGMQTHGEPDVWSHSTEQDVLQVIVRPSDCEDSLYSEDL